MIFYKTKLISVSPTVVTLGEVLGFCSLASGGSDEPMAASSKEERILNIFLFILMDSISNRKQFAPELDFFRWGGLSPVAWFIIRV